MPFGFYYVVKRAREASLFDNWVRHLVVYQTGTEVDVFCLVGPRRRGVILRAGYGMYEDKYRMQFADGRDTWADGWSCTCISCDVSCQWGCGAKIIVQDPGLQRSRCAAPPLRGGAAQTPRYIGAAPLVVLPRSPSHGFVCHSWPAPACDALQSLLCVLCLRCLCLRFWFARGVVGQSVSSRGVWALF